MNISISIGIYIWWWAWICWYFEELARFIWFFENLFSDLATGSETVSAQTIGKPVSFLPLTAHSLLGVRSYLIKFFKFTESKWRKILMIASKLLQVLTWVVSRPWNIMNYLYTAVAQFIVSNNYLTSLVSNNFLKNSLQELLNYEFQYF